MPDVRPLGNFHPSHREAAKDTVVADMSRQAGRVIKRQPEIDMARNAQEAIGERQLMSAFSPGTDADPARARSDQAFRQKLFEQSLDAVLLGMKKLRGAAPSAGAGGGAKQLREGVELAVRLAEMIQNAGGRPRSF
jgi:hypothetical protein